jgi:hypothetical protein
MRMSSLSTIRADGIEWPPATPRLERSMIEAAIRANCFIGQYGDVPAVNGVTVAADAIWSMHCAELAQAKETAGKERTP